MSDTPFGGTADQQAQWAHDNINSTFSTAAWKAMGPMDSGCPPNLPYRSHRAGGDNACVEHPDNCPEGKTLDGTTCISNEAANQKYGGGYGGVPQGGAPQPAANPWAAYQPQPAQPAQPQMPAAPQAGMAIPNTGITGRGTMPSLPQTLSAYQQPQQSATQGLLQQSLAGRQAVGGVPTAMGSGWSAGADGLTQMLAKQQRKPGVAGTGQWWA